MGVKIKKERFLKELGFKKVYCVLPGPNLVEHILTGHQYNMFLNSKNGEKEIKNPVINNIPFSYSSKDIKLYSLNPRELISKYSNWAGTNNFYKKLKTSFDSVKDSQSLDSIYEVAFDNKLFIVSEILDVNMPFAKKEEEFFEFLKEREMYCFSSSKATIEVVFTKPEIKIREIEYLYSGTKIKLGFEIKINGRTFDESDLYYYNDKFHIKDLFDTKEQLIDYNIAKLNSQLAYFEEMKGTKPEGMLITNKSFVL